jgi:hypothetical protein
MVITEKIENITEWRRDICWGKFEGHIGTL